jgi:hypothetical protein
VRAQCSFDYALVRVVPRVERGEFLNAGVIVFCLTEEYLDARVDLDGERLRAFAPSIDIALISSHLEVIPRVCRGSVDAGPIGQLPLRSRWHWLVAPRSTVIQTSPVHSGVGDNLELALNSLFDKLVKQPRTSA